MKIYFIIFAIIFSIAVSSQSYAQGKILATAGNTTFEGSAGGGLVPWSVIAGYETEDEIAFIAGASIVKLDDFEMQNLSIATGISDRLELSYSEQSLHVDPLDTTIRQSIIGAKVKLAGNFVYGPLPQIALGAQYKDNRDADMAQSLGAKKTSDTDFYLAVSQLYFDALWGRNIAVDITARYTRANQTGFLGFGSDEEPDRTLQLESSIGLFITPEIAVGLEYRQKPNNFSSIKEDDWYDSFIAWHPNKNISFVLAHINAGDIAGLSDQDGTYLSLQWTP